MAKATQKQVAPAFAPSGPPPPKVKAPIISRESAEALVAALSDSEWITDGETYAEPRDAHNRVNGYRRALASYSLIPDGQTLRSRVGGDEGALYVVLRWGDARSTVEEVTEEVAEEATE